LTKEFRKSEWTDQEVGAAIGRRIPIIPVNMGINPYGFMKEIQALHIKDGINKEDAVRIFELMMLNGAIQQSLRHKLLEGFASAESFDQANLVVKSVVKLDYLNSDELATIEAAYNTNE